MRLLVALGLWAAWLAVFTLVVLAIEHLPDGAPFFIVLFYVVVLFNVVARVEEIQGRRWYIAFGIFIPGFNLLVLGSTIWYCAGRIVGAERRPLR